MPRAAIETCNWRSDFSSDVDRTKIIRQVRPTKEVAETTITRSTADEFGFCNANRRWPFMLLAVLLFLFGQRIEQFRSVPDTGHPRSRSFSMRGG